MLFFRIHEFLWVLYHFGFFLKDKSFKQTFSVETLFIFRLFDLLSCKYSLRVLFFDTFLYGYFDGLLMFKHLLLFILFSGSREGTWLSP